MMHPSHPTEPCRFAEHPRAVPKPDRRRHRLEVAEGRRAADGVRLIAPAAYVHPTMDDADPLRISA